MLIEELFFNIYYNRCETVSEVHTQFYNKHSVNFLLTWADWHLKTELQRRFPNNVELELILGETLKIADSTE
jgi:hypothetical protein